MDDDTDAKMNLTAPPPPDYWKRLPRHPHITWLNAVQCDLRTHYLTLNEAVDLAQNHPLWRLMCTMALRTPNSVCQKRKTKK